MALKHELLKYHKWDPNYKAPIPGPCKRLNKKFVDPAKDHYTWPQLKQMYMEHSISCKVNDPSFKENLKQTVMNQQLFNVITRAPTTGGHRSVHSMAGYTKWDYLYTLMLKWYPRMLSKKSGNQVDENNPYQKAYQSWLKTHPQEAYRM